MRQVVVQCVSALVLWFVLWWLLFWSFMAMSGTDARFEVAVISMALSAGVACLFVTKIQNKT